jgi:hypothetical protein
MIGFIPSQLICFSTCWLGIVAHFRANVQRSWTCEDRDREKINTGYQRGLYAMQNRAELVICDWNRCKQQFFGHWETFIAAAGWRRNS